MVTPLMQKVRACSLRQYAIAKQAFMTEGRLSRLINGHTKPKPAEAQVLAAVLSCTPEEIFPPAPTAE